MVVTADVHYAAAHYYDPKQAAVGDFDPFWEFVAGPLNAGTFGPNPLDATFGPEVRFLGIPPGMKPNRPPSDGFQFFGGQHDLQPLLPHQAAAAIAGIAMGQLLIA